MNNIRVSFSIREYNKIKYILIVDEIKFHRFFWGEFNRYSDFILAKNNF